MIFFAVAVNLLGFNCVTCLYKRVYAFPWHIVFFVAKEENLNVCDYLALFARRVQPPPFNTGKGFLNG